MEITRSENDGTIILAPSGRIDQDSSAAFQAALSGEIASTPPASVVVDFTAIEYISSVGLRALMIGAKESKANGGKLAVAALCPVVQEVFQIVRRHIIWNNLRPDLKEDLAHLVQDIKRRICGIASAGSPSFSV